MKKNRIKINVPGKYTEECNELKNSTCTKQDKRNEDDNNSMEEEMHELGRPPNSDEMPVGDNVIRDMTMDMPYPSGFINGQDYAESYTQEWNATEPRLLNPMKYSPIVYAMNSNISVASNEVLSSEYQNQQNIVAETQTVNSFPKFRISKPLRTRPDNSIRLPYMFVNKDDVANIGFGIYQSKLRWYNYWITTEDSARVTASVVQMFGRENVYITKSFFFKKNNSYDGERVILITQIPQRPYKFINKLNRKMSCDKRTVKSVNGDYLISRDCIFIIVSNYSVEYICSNYYKYHKNEAEQIQTLMKSLKQKFTYMDLKDICN